MQNNFRFLVQGKKLSGLKNARNIYHKPTTDHTHHNF